MDLGRLLGGQALWWTAERIERRRHVWFNRPVRIGGTWRTACVIEINERIVEGPFVQPRVKGRRALELPRRHAARIGVGDPAQRAIPGLQPIESSRETARPPARYSGYPRGRRGSVTGLRRASPRP